MKMPERFQPLLISLGTYLLWIILAVLVTLTLFQVHATLTAITLVAVENPATRPAGWSTNTVYGFSRIIWLFLGIIWLGWVMLTLDYLREGQKYHLLTKRVLRLLVIMGVVYIASYLILLMLV